MTTESPDHIAILRVLLDNSSHSMSLRDLVWTTGISREVLAERLWDLCDAKLTRRFTVGAYHWYDLTASGLSVAIKQSGAEEYPAPEWLRRRSECPGWRRSAGPEILTVLLNADRPMRLSQIVDALKGRAFVQSVASYLSRFRASGLVSRSGKSWSARHRITAAGVQAIELFADNEKAARLLRLRYRISRMPLTTLVETVDSQSLSRNDVRTLLLCQGVRIRDEDLSLRHAHRISGIRVWRARAG